VYDEGKVEAREAAKGGASNDAGLTSEVLRHQERSEGKLLRSVKRGVSRRSARWSSQTSRGKQKTQKAGGQPLTRLGGHRTNKVKEVFREKEHRKRTKGTYLPLCILNVWREGVVIEG